MTDKEFVHNFLNKNYKIGSTDTQLCCYCIGTKKCCSFVMLLVELQHILGKFASFKVVDEWYKSEINKITTIINDKLKKN